MSKSEGEKKKRARAENGQPKASRALAKLTTSLAPVAASVGSVLPGTERLVVQVELGQPMGALARQLGLLLREENIYRTPQNEVVTLDEETGKTELMVATAFVTWTENFCLLGRTKADGEFKRASLLPGAAAVVLSSGDFKKQLRLLRGVSSVRVPAWANAEKTTVRLLPPGYDGASQLFVLDGVPIQEDLGEEKGLEWLQETLREFPWADTEGPLGLAGSRAFAAHLAHCLAHFGRLLTAGGNRPLFVLLANQAGSGKTLLAKMAIAATYGAASNTPWAKEETEQAKALLALCVEGAPYIFFDNLRGHLSSGELEGFLTSATRTGRILGKTGNVTAENVAIMSLTGNGLTLNADLARRAVLIELFAVRDAAARTFADLLTETVIVSREFRSAMLSALWSLIKLWSDCGCPSTEKRSPPGRVLPSFEEFCRIWGGVLGQAGLADPFERGQAEELDEVSAGWRKLLGELAGELAPKEERSFTSETILARAEELGLTPLLIGDAAKPSIVLGKRLKPWRGRELQDTRGRWFVFDKRGRKGAGNNYGVRILPEGGAEAAA